MRTKIVNYSITETSIESFRLLVSSGQFSDLKKMCVALLKEHYSKGLTRPEISFISGKKEQCLTAVLKLLCVEGNAFVCGVRLNKETRRNNQVYKLANNG